MMNTTFKPDLKSKTYCISKSYSRLTEKEISSINSKFYQKLLIVLTSLSISLIIPESPHELEYICNSYNSSKLCNVW